LEDYTNNNKAWVEPFSQLQSPPKRPLNISTASYE